MIVFGCTFAAFIVIVAYLVWDTSEEIKMMKEFRKQERIRRGIK